MKNIGTRNEFLRPPKGSHKNKGGSEEMLILGQITFTPHQ